MIEAIRFLGFSCVLFSFGFLSSIVLSILNSTVLLFLLSLPIGIAFYVFLCHVLSFILGPSAAVIYSFFILLISSFVLVTLNLKKCLITLKEAKGDGVSILIGTAFMISFTSFFAISKMGIFDVELHVPLALSIFHNNVYPPKDLFRPEFDLLYHYGGDVFAGAIHKICGIHIDTAFELASSFSASLMYFAFVALAYILTSNWKTSLICALCTYFGGGLLWLDSGLRFLLSAAPAGPEGWGFFQTFLNIGLHGGIFNAPSVTAFTSTYSLGLPLLITSILLFYLPHKEGRPHFTVITRQAAITAICLFSLFLCAEWLFVTFFAGAIPFALFHFLRTKDKSAPIHLLIILVLWLVLTGTLGNGLFLREDLQYVGRAHLFNLGVKEDLFSIPSWGRLTSGTMELDVVDFFSWKAIAEFGISYVLFPVTLLYLFKSKNGLAIFLFLMSILTFPIPLFMEFRANPVEFNRLFAYANSTFILLITCAMVYFHIHLKRHLFILYVVLLTLTPVFDLVLSAAVSPHLSFNKTFTQMFLNGLSNVRSPAELINCLSDIHRLQKELKQQVMPLNREDIVFLREKSLPLQVAISNRPSVPLYAGTYTLVPAGKYVYKDFMYTSFDGIYRTVLEGLDEKILKELNVKWILIYTNEKLRASDTFYRSVRAIGDKVFERETDFSGNQKGKTEIYHIREFDSIPGDKEGKAAWVISDKNGDAAEMSLLKEKKISLFSTSKSARRYIERRFTKQTLKKETVTSQLVMIDELMGLVRRNGGGITIEKQF